MIFYKMLSETKFKRVVLILLYILEILTIQEIPKKRLFLKYLENKCLVNFLEHFCTLLDNVIVTYVIYIVVT